MVEVEGEVASFKVNQQKYVFFDLKDSGGLVSCFMSVWQLKVPIEDGMRVIVRAVPKVTAWGKFSLTIQAIKPSGEGSIKRARQLLKDKLEKEGLFADERKRSLPEMPDHIGVISSVESAGYKDFIKIINERWGGARVDVAHVQVQGESSPSQIVRAFQYFNEQADLPEILVLIRGGGSAEDLGAFDDEAVVRAVSSSRIPVLTGIGHEVDETLVDFAADVRASTPSHAAQLVFPDKNTVLYGINSSVSSSLEWIINRKSGINAVIDSQLSATLAKLRRLVDGLQSEYQSAERTTRQLDPRVILRRGYAVVRDANGHALGADRTPRAGDVLLIETNEYNIKSEVVDVKEKNQRNIA